MKKRIITIALAFLVAFSATSGAGYKAKAASSSANIYRNDSSYLVQKVSNPSTGSGEADGLEEGTDRENSYAWCMQELEDEHGDYIYIGSNRNILYAALSGFMAGTGDPEIMKAMINTVTNGELKTDTSAISFAQACIVRYNVKTQTIETYFDAADYSSGVYSYISGFRACIPFKGSLYFNANSTHNGMIWRVSSNNQSAPEVVFNEEAGYMRAMTVSTDGKTMYVGGTDKRSSDVMDDATPYKINIYSTTNGENYNLIADYKDFTQYEQEGYFTTGGDVWDMVEYNGSLYLTLMTQHGAIVYEAHKATDAESDKANAYGWVWTDIVGETENSVYGAGFGNVLNYAASPYIYNGDLYFITFSDAMDSVIYGAYGLLSTLASEQPDMETYFRSLKMMEANMNNETSVFRLTSDGKMQMVVGDSKNCPKNIEYVAKIGAGFNDEDYSTTEYNWRATVYDGKLYIGTFDAYPMYKYLTKLTNGDLFEMTDEEFRQQLEYAIEFLTLISGSSQNDVDTYSIADDSETTNIELAAELYLSLTKPYSEGASSVSILNSIMNTADSEEYATNGSLSDEEIQTLVEALVYLHGQIDGEATTEVVSKLLNSIQVEEGAVASVSDSIDDIINKLNDWKDLLSDDTYKEAIDALTEVLTSLKSVLDVFRNVDQDGVNCYVRVSDTIASNDNPGFELYCTEDGTSYDAVTIDGFNDEYNYGCRTLLAGSDGLYVGTANPFYGAQLWRVNENTADLEDFYCNIDDITNSFDANITDYSAKVSSDVESFELTFVPADPGNTVYLNGATLEGFNGIVSLNTGENIITVENVSVDGSKSTVYTFTIIKAEADKNTEDTDKPADKDTNNAEEDKNQSNPQDAPKTGDYFNPALYSALILVSGALAIGTIKRKRV